ncbi:MAG: M20/M25/M40 family metallo-hydrolase [Alphaproteobacteria bacterium]|nr:M20/M25/M40 family metallo-hydrolase [Alphaproteobacteria bacterium]
MLRAILIFLVSTLLASTAHAGDTVHHKMDITLDPASHQITATDEITIPASLAKDGMEIQINSDLVMTKVAGAVTLTKVSDGKNAKDIGIDRDNDKKDTIIKVSHYKITGIKPGEKTNFTVSLSGKINNPVIQLNEEYARGFSQSPGLIEERGVYLAGATYWVPTVKDTLITYDITVKMPADWRSVSQGARVKHDTGDFHIDGWKADTPTEEIYLIAAKFTEYELPVGNVKAMAFLRTPDAAMANKYLETTAQYMEMYRGILGPYPYSKFALVENFWETGYGMPSFTLLGSQIIRFPFILHSSYPHELLHNWWGNGVFIDFETGNWAEGLTAYMADHLVAEQRGKGADYRRSTLQRYTDYVDEKTDFPLRKFLSRHNAVTEAVGYGKTGMVWNMLRNLVGDENFKRSFQRFYRSHKFEVGTFDDIRVAFEETTGKDLKPFFTQWVDGVGAPELTLSETKQSGDKLNLTLKQVQKHAPFTLQVPVAIYTADTVERHVLPMTKRTQDYSLSVKGHVVRVEVDPEFDLFRRLHWAEIPPSLGSAFGADHVVMVLPSKASDALKKRYQMLTDIWAGGGNMTVVKDSELKELPKDGAIWVLGRDNLFYGVIEDALKNYNASVSADSVQFGKQKLALADNSTIIAVRNPANPQSVVVGLTAHNDAAVKGLTRKLPHYGKYSYLAFTNVAPDNSAKGQWPAVGSPLVAILDTKVTSTAKLKPRPALAQLKPVFDGKRMMSHVTYLSSPELEGRGVGTAGLDKAAAYIADSFKASGLTPAGADGGWFQPFEVNGPDGKPVKVKNVVGIIPGKNPKLKGQSVVLSAHYDHLGHGWPNVRDAFKGQVHPGADDNASGIAVMLELAKSLAKSAPDRTIVFLASTAEESGLLGARHYVKVMKDYPVTKAIANVNLDTVGRAGEKVMVFGGTSATEWRFIFMGTTATTGIQTDIVMQAVNASDHTAFLEAGVPAIHLFGSPTAEYHRPSDTADKVKLASLMKVAALTKEVVEYLGTRPEPLTSTLKPVDPNAPKVLPPARPRSGRKVSTGAMPDFAFSGKGVKVSQVAPNSAGAKAGLTAGDVITSFGGETVTNLRDYTKVLGKYNPGDKVRVVVLRDGKKVSFDMILKKR